MKTTRTYKPTTLIRKSYQSPHVRKLGSVGQLTLKLGSLSDGMSGHL
ncbi:hypothetical protein [Spirosoma validum]|uniref:Lasso RiPP family leader peptide-containing protein n=1 Tax=Spirosoma validum TaxID=2771355 RepID=A0A927B974_9BACT|nr:hypothetical protein [Spirosoma validum]MBD2757502.1 hypothetical protein [Spirosoma validum]